jgi:glycosyltransferase involved in cell wall biosynthesis
MPLRTSRPGTLYSAMRSLLSGRSYNATWLDGRELAVAVARALREVAPDVIHVDSAMIAGRLPSFSGIPAVLDHHNVESAMMERRVAHTRGLMRAFCTREARLLRALERDTAVRFVEHVVVSELDAGRLREVVPSARCTVVPNGVDTEYFKPAARTADGRTLVFAGRMNWYPNEHGILHFIDTAWPEVKRRVPEARLVVAGMNPTHALRERARQDRAIEITGFVEDIRPVITAASVYVCPILDGGGTRLKLLDAMALGMPIVSTPVAAEGLDAEDGTHLLIRECDTRFVDAVVACLEDPQRCSELGGAARSLAVRRYDWSIVGEELVRAYRRVGSSERTRLLGAR